MAEFDLYTNLQQLLSSYSVPCADDCNHSQCPLLRDLYALRIKGSLERARLTVKPIIDRERKGEEIGDLMDIRFHRGRPGSIPG